MLKPTVVYGFFALLLLGGWIRGKAMLKYVLELAFEGVDEAGWLKLSRNWGVFFLVLAFANVAMWRLLSFETWLVIKVWGMMIVLFLFSLANIPMLLKHGLKLGDEQEAPTQG